MNSKKIVILLVSFLFCSISHAKSFNSSFNQLAVDGFTDKEIVSLFKKLSPSQKRSQYYIDYLFEAALNPYAPVGSHAGKKFYEALAWYNDIVLGNKNGKFTLSELQVALEQESKKYLTILYKGQSATQRISSWKMLQKLTLLKKEIQSSKRKYYKYRAKTLFKVDYTNDWNKKNTISSRKDFEKRVIQASYKKPVLIKFGLTYCVHCLLMENLGSVPAVAKKYKNELSVYKLWWNPNDNANYGVLNQIASEEGITSSPMFNLYIDGQLVKSDYAFPDEEGNGLEEFLEGFL